MTQAFAKKLWQGLIVGYGIDPANIEYDTADGDMIKNLQQNVYAFSAAKNWQQMKALTQALIDGDNKLRTFSQFKKEAFAINDAHVNQWLKTEYNTAIASGQMASKWVQIQTNKASLPMLEFDAVIDGRTSDICKPLNGIIRPADDPFWSQYYPPNHFGCRSTVRQLSGRKATDISTFSAPDNIPDMFKVNLAEKGMAFPPGHNYYIGIPNRELNNALLLMPEKDQYKIVYKGKNGSLQIHLKPEAEKKTDLQDLLLIGNELAVKGRNVKILPEIHFKEPVLRAKLLPGMKGNKNCDLLIDSEYWEVEKPTLPINYKKLKNRIKDGAKQADRVIILLEENYDADIFSNLASERFSVLPHLQGLMFRTNNGKYIKFLK